MWFRVSRVRVPLPTPDISGESRSSGSGSLLIESGFYDGVSPSGKARDFDSRIRWFESGHPSHLFDPLAQLAEHLPFKQGVRGSNPRWLTTSEWTARHSKSPASAGLFSCFRLLSPSAHKILRCKLSRSPMAPVFQRLHGIFFHLK